MSASNDQMHAAKDILLALIEQKYFVMPGKEKMDVITKDSEINDQRINEINRAYSSILNNIVQSQTSARR